MATSADKVPMLAEGHRKLTDELKRLRHEERPAIVEAIEEARAHGDLSENAEYHAAKERQGQVEATIADLEDRLSRAMVIDPTTLSGDKVVFGATVTLLDEDNKKIRYQLVGQVEADANQGRISYNSPLGRALIGRQVGEEVEVSAPGGDRSYEIKKIEFILVGQRFPRTATNIIAALTALAWVVTVALGLGEQAAYQLGFIPLRVTQTVAWALVPAVLTPLTATFVHSGLVHVGFNLLMLLWCGTAVERTIGAKGLVILYIVGAYAAAAAQWAVDPAGAVPTIGASGAISAVVGAFALSFGRARAFTNNLRLNRWINVVWLLAAWVVLQFMMGWLAGAQGYLLATPAHVGGFAAGLMLQRPLLLWHYRKA